MSASARVTATPGSLRPYGRDRISIAANKPITLFMSSSSIAFACFRGLMDKLIAMVGLNPPSDSSDAKVRIARTKDSRKIPHRTRSNLPPQQDEHDQSSGV
jgi:hypothetical protein